MYNFRTDLALERRDIYKKVNKLNEIDGVESILILQPGKKIIVLNFR